jgi:hypothetical protein
VEAEILTSSDWGSWTSLILTGGHVARHVVKVTCVDLVSLTFILHRLKNSILWHLENRAKVFRQTDTAYIFTLKLGIDSDSGKTFSRLHTVHTASAAHPASYAMGTGCSSQGAWSSPLNTHHQLLRSRMTELYLYPYHGSLRPYSRFSRREPLLFLKVAPQLYSRGWVDPVPDPLLFFGSAGNRTRASGSVAKNSDH